MSTALVNYDKDWDRYFIEVLFPDKFYLNLFSIIVRVVFFIFENFAANASKESY